MARWSRNGVITVEYAGPGNDLESSRAFSSTGLNLALLHPQPRKQSPAGRSDRAAALQEISTIRDLCRLEQVAFRRPLLIIAEESMARRSALVVNNLPGILKTPPSRRRARDLRQVHARNIAIITGGTVIEKIWA